ncbi:iron complex transport system substrate-binding protein [Oikeobacillus pervagus]|uniref:Iron complex transport system substrate-binding protein n=1 Tax=Oikeobacillus pervagus TaxID=1325931 RepID=A0AAJ1T0A0_9BACI|nr:iron-siderophore ABC transporter substrate-binding protein [Oikeobacillus pervagus]MDQ0216154.1 iron complex transport system substrate-binding protein [Oikeobacillus pervagus]
MRSYSKATLAFVAALFLLVMAACGNNDTSKKEEATKEKPKEEQAYTIKHAMGETPIPKTPKRIVILTNEGIEALLAMGVKPVGAVEAFSGDPWYDHLSDQLKGVEVVGTEQEVNVEKIAALQPDLIIGNKIRQEAIYDKLNKIAPTVFAETLRGDWQENLQLYAKAINKENKGKEVLDNYNKHVEDVKQKLGDKTNQTISMVRFMPGRTRIYYTDSFSGVIFDQLGFKRPENQEKLFENPGKLGKLAVEVDKELIPEMDGDILFYFTYAPKDDKSGLELEKEWTNDPLWKNLNAVKNEKVYKVDDVIWNTAGGVIAANEMLDQLEEMLAK